MAGMMLEAREVTKNFGATKALDRVSFALQTGDVHALIGENGAGKSTLVSLMLRFADPQQGRVLLGGQDGHFNSASFLDQAELWFSGAYIEMPLRIETVRERFAHRIELGG